MKLEITKKHLVDAIARMKEVATKAVKSEFEDAGRITIDAQDKKVVFLSTNGLTFASFEVTSETDTALKIEEQGTVTVNASMAHASCRAVGGRFNDHVLALTSSGNSLTIQDLDKVRKNKKLQSEIELEVLGGDHKFRISTPKKGFTYRFRTDVLRDAVNAVAKYRPSAAYRVEYEQICMHFLKDQIRFVVGNGARFAIYCITLDTNGNETGMPNISDLDDAGVKHILPVDQAVILLQLMEGSEHTTLICRDDTHIYVKPENGAVVDIKGIPQVSYIAYEKHAFRTEEAKSIVDVQTKELEEGASIIWAVRDKELEGEGNYHTYSFVVGEGEEAFLAVTDKANKARFRCLVDYYNIDSDKFKSDYAARVLQEVYGASAEKEYIRFYCIDEKTVMIAEPVNLNENEKDEHGVPKVVRKDAAPRLFFFFASARESEDG